MTGAGASASRAEEERRALTSRAGIVAAGTLASRRVAWVTPLPIAAPSKPARSRRFGVAIAFVLLLILFTLALSIVLKPRGHDMPQELSAVSARVQRT